MKLWNIFRIIIFIILINQLNNLFVNNRIFDKEQEVLTVTELDKYAINDYFLWFKTRKEISPQLAFATFSSGEGKRMAPNDGLHATFENDYYWLSLHLVNSDPSSSTLYLQLNNPHLDRVKVFQKTDKGIIEIYKTGAIYPFSTRPYLFYDFVLPLTIPAEESTEFLIMVQEQGKIFSITPELMSANYFKSKEQKIYIIFGLFLGIMFFNMLVNIFLGISLGDNIHFLYCFYILSSIAWLFSSIAAEFQFIFPNHPQWFNLSQSITGAVTMILMSWLAYVFLKIKEQKFFAKIFLKSITWFLTALLPIKLVIEVFLPNQTQIIEWTLHAYLIGIAGIAIGIIWNVVVRIRQGFTPAWFYLVAMSYLIMSIIYTCFQILKSGNLIELFAAPTHIQIGLQVEALIIFLGIIYRYKQMKVERTKLRKLLDSQEFEMNKQIIYAQEEERRRLAQDLHDDVGATLSTLILHISNASIQSNLSKAYLLQFNKQSLLISQKALSDLRNISHDLLPLAYEANGLFSSLKDRINSLRKSTPIQLVLNTDGDEGKLKNSKAIILYRIINELLINAIKHAEAKEINIDIVLAEEITLIVEDNGKGFDFSKTLKGIGIRNVKSRVAFLGGKVEFDSNKNGTSVIINVPYHNLNEL